MQVMNMSEKRFEGLKPLKLANYIFNTEAEMYMIDEKVNWSKKKYILKRLYNDIGTIFSNKLYTVNELIDKKDEIGIDELIMPEQLVSVRGKLVGFTVPWINNINFQEVLDSSEFSNEQKIGYFKEIGELLEHMKKVRNYTSVTDFYLNDLHENNFILNTDTGRINAVDMDSCKINGNYPFASRYLTPFSPIYNVSKYKKIIGGTSVGGCYDVDYNSDIFCYITMILNHLFGNRIGKLKIEEFYDYMSYLREIGVSYELIDKFSLIYSEKDNENPYEYLDELSNVVGRSNYKVYNLSRKK